ncbi:YeeE/YedE family protein [Xanthomonas sp. NCPPB 2632]|uniref:YeeE/YedE family protein n=1 Tax=Xanthomonas sp. NCPPB 2632 TaxID=3240912 RepID=UPI003511B022
MAWYWPALGGAAIGIAAGIVLLAQGRVMGISGMLAAIPGWAPGNDRVAAALFLTASVIAAGLTHPLLHRPALDLARGWPTLIVGGLLVGYGTRLGAGCTSGHGVCGLSRLSPRSLWATCVFMLTAAATVYMMRHGLERLR